MHRGTEERTIWLMCPANIYPQLRRLVAWVGLPMQTQPVLRCIPPSFYIYISIRIWDEAWRWSAGIGYIGGAYPQCSIG